MALSLKIELFWYINSPKCIEDIFSYIKLFFTDGTEDEDANREYIEDTNKDAVMIAASKLVVRNAVPKVKY